MSEVDKELLLRYMEAVWLGGRLNVLFEQAVREKEKAQSEQSAEYANRIARITGKAWARVKRIRAKLGTYGLARRIDERE